MTQRDPTDNGSAGCADDTSIGRVLDERYRIEAKIGLGGVGAVYRATHLKLGQPVAIKLLLERYGQHPAQLRRFEREAKALAALAHPNIVAVTDYGVSGDTPYLVMELLQGESLADRLSRGALAPEATLELARQLLRALAFVHEAGLVHRDLKPGNVFLQRLPDGEERLKLLDFGLAKFVEDAPGRGEPTLTRVGDMMGTPAYMSPEQIGGDPADARTDVYAMGVILFEMLSGRKPFDGEPAEMLRDHLAAAVPTLHEAQPRLHACAELDALIARAMAKQRQDRFADAAELLRALEAVPQPWVHIDAAQPERVSNTLTAAATVVSTPGDRGDAADAVYASAAPATRAALGIVARVRNTIASILAAGVRVLTTISLIVIVAAAALVYVMKSPARTHERVALERFGEHVAPRLEDLAVAATRLHDSLTTDAGTRLAPPPSAAEPAALPAATAATPTAAASAQTTSTAARPTPGKPAVRVAAKNAWARGVPKDLRIVRKAILAGEYGSERAIALLRKYAADHPDDPRGYLLLARLYLNRHWRADAIGAYLGAYQRDPSCRGTPPMLPDIVELVAQGAVADKAARLVHDAYGNEALAVLDRRLASKHEDPAALARLRALRARIAVQ